MDSVKIVVIRCAVQILLTCLRSSLSPLRGSFSGIQKVLHAALKQAGRHIVSLSRSRAKGLITHQSRINPRPWVTASCITIILITSKCKKCGVACPFSDEGLRPFGILRVRPALHQRSKRGRYLGRPCPGHISCPLDHPRTLKAAYM